MESANKRPRTNGGIRSCSGSDVNRLHNQEIIRIKRHVPPAHYSLKVHQYSLLCSKTDKYESGVFEAGGYKWRLVFYPNGDKLHNGENHISLYLEIAETETFLVPWEVNAEFKLFVHNQLEDKFLAVQEAKFDSMKRFHAMKTTWGFAQLLELETFKDPSNGYLIDDSCVFGAEVLVIKHTGNWESFSFAKSPRAFNWQIYKFSELNKDLHESLAFTVGGKNWKLRICPTGEGEHKGKSLSVYLITSNWGSNPTKSSTYSEYKLRVLDQVNGKHLERSVSYWFSFSPKNYGYGYPNFLPLEDLRKPSNGFIVNDCLTIQVEFMVVSETKYFPGTSGTTDGKDRVPLAPSLFKNEN